MDMPATWLSRTNKSLTDPVQIREAISTTFHIARPQISKPTTPDQKNAAGSAAPAAGRLLAALSNVTDGIRIAAASPES
jgi:hypothetical protein